MPCELTDVSLSTTFQGSSSSTRVLEAAIREKVVFVPGRAFHASEPEPDTLRLSYSMLGDRNAGEAARRLKLAWDAVTRG